jgi:hypothetical protein
MHGKRAGFSFNIAEICRELVVQRRGASRDSFFATLLSALIALFLVWCAPNGANARSLIIYYSNETVAEALKSRNYQALLFALDGLQSQTGYLAAEDVRSDARTFRAQVLKDIKSLENVARTNAIDLAVFTNALALRGQYLVVRSTAEELLTLDVAPTSDDPVAEYSPLSFRMNFRAAMIDALRGYTNKDEVILILNSHGSKQFAIVPRVAGDFTHISVDDLRQDLEKVQGDDQSLQKIELRGIKKIDLWQELDFATQAAHVNLALVFLETCEGAASSWKEYFAVPSTVRYVAHSGFASISLEQFDYSLLSRLEQPPYTDRNQIRLMTDFLRETRVVYFDTRYSYWRWPLLVTAMSLPKLFYFAPLGFWLFASLFKLRGGFFRNVEYRSNG